MLGVFVGRQPIFDRQLEVIGYKLLFHKYEEAQAEFIDETIASSHLILNTFMEIGLERLVGSGLAFINLTRDSIIEKHPLKLLQDRVVLEIKKNIIEDKDLLLALHELSNHGFKIAIDGVVDPDDVNSLIDIVSIVNLDIAAIEQKNLKGIVTALKLHKVKLLAGNVETLDTFDICKSLKFDYFQGFFLSKPNLKIGERMPATRMAILRLLAKLHDPDIEFKELNEIIKEDVTLSYRLLRLINSVFYARSKKIESIHQALTLLGIRRVQEWVSMLLLLKFSSKPNELTITAMERAKMCELLTQALNEKEKEKGFMVGMFSVLDGLLDMPMNEILKTLPLSDEISAALLRHEGPLGAVLHCVLAYERGEWEETWLPDIERGMILNAFLESLDWATTVSSLL
ncbi:MAG TPA: HDOD domain-containing protein [Anaerolineae bacterium]|nr:HDOD domain-containing protein [Anaerolineae bacterium]